MNRRLRLIPILAGLLAAACIFAAAPEPLHLSAQSAILIDQASGRVLYERGADRPFVPASLAKLMSLHIVFEKLADRSIARGDVVTLSANAWAGNQKPGSTLMNLGPGQIVTVEELMKGMAVASGNDAATALAEYVAGSTREFVRLMNEEARFMGYAVTRFTDPAGVAEGNQVSAREFADFCRRYIEWHPEALAELHSLREFDYPLPRNMPDGRLEPRRTRKQYNGNYLVWDGIGVDGLKTGHLDDENFTAAITARRGDTRLIVVLLGVPGRTLAEGSRNRSMDAMALLSYGFRNYATIALDAPSLPSVHVWQGEDQELPMAPSTPVRLTVRADELAKLAYTVLVQEPLVAPVMHGQKVGDPVYTAGTEEVARIPLVAAAEVQGAGLLRRVWDAVVLGLSSFVGSTAEAVRTALDTLPPTAIVSSSIHERRAP